MSERDCQFGYITTYTGRTVHFDDPDPESIDIRDIAHALSNQCRFAGHTRRFYSVAEHSIYVAMQCPGFHLEGLLHDAAEAYMVDMPTPIKRLIPNYKDYENRLMTAIADKFKLAYPLPDVIHDADTAQLVIEAKELLTLSDWTAAYKSKAPGIPPRGYKPEEIEELFMNYYNFWSASAHSANHNPRLRTITCRA